MNKTNYPYSFNYQAIMQRMPMVLRENQWIIK